MRRLMIAIAATALLAACSSDDTAGTAGAGGAAGSPEGGIDRSGVSSSSLDGSQAGGAHMLAPGVPDRVLFDTDQSSLSGQARGVLDSQATWLQRTPGTAVQIAGNADERGTEEYNLALGERRASAARDYLVSHGVQGSRITTISYGKDQPTAMGSTPDAWAQNRNAITAPR